MKKEIIEFQTAKKQGSGFGFGKRTYHWDVPMDLMSKGKKGIFVGVGRWLDKKIPFVCIVVDGKPVYFEESQIKILLESLQQKHSING